MTGGDEPTTQELRALQAGREEAERERAQEADLPQEKQAAKRRAEKAAYLRDKLAEQEEALEE